MTVSELIHDMEAALERAVPLESIEVVTLSTRQVEELLKALRQLQELNRVVRTESLLPNGG